MWLFYRRTANYLPRQTMRTSRLILLSAYHFHRTLSQIFRSQTEDMNVLCAVCLERLPSEEIHTTRCCQTSWCRKCLVEALKRASSGPPGPYNAFTPVRCCMRSRLLSKRPRGFVSPATFARYQRKVAEHETPYRDRVYCFKCNEWIPPSHISGTKKRAYCLPCGSITCVQCKEAHHSPPCQISDRQADDTELRQAGVKRCPQCGCPTYREGGCKFMK